MNKKLFIGNLSFKITEAELEDIFKEAGEVVSVAIPVDRVTNRKRGFAFVEMGTEQEAENAISMFHGKEIQGRELAVTASKPKERTGGPR